MRLIDFVVQDWIACAPGMSSHEQWQEWLVHQSYDFAEKAVLPISVPKSLQHRLNPLGRAVFSVDGDLLSLPSVFSAAYGKVNKSLVMLKAMQKGDEVSLTSLSLSVHNAVASLFSITTTDKALVPGNHRHRWE
jgi:hypothetical protein